jgi:pimeloyl-ACP methyl ester carboxylesterase
MFALLATSACNILLPEVPAQLREPTPRSTSAFAFATAEPTLSPGEPTRTPAPTVTPLPTARSVVKPTIKTTGCFFKFPQGQSKSTVDCGTINVPERHAEPDGKQIKIAYARFKSKSKTPAEPVFYLSGGPGGSGIDEAILLYRNIVRPLIDTRDVVIFDQRGTGNSTPLLKCPEYLQAQIEAAVNRSRLTKDAQRKLTYDALEACNVRLKKQSDINFANYVTSESAADIEALRLALGYEKISLWGTSYGTTLALVTMRDYSEHIRSSVLEAVAPPQINLVETNAYRVDRALNKLFDGCAKDAACNKKYPNLEKVFYGLVDKLNAKPVRLNVPTGGRNIRAEANGDDLIVLIFYATYNTELITYLPKFIYDFQRGNYAMLQALYALPFASYEFISIGMHYSVMCAEEAAFTTSEKITKANASFPRLSGGNDKGANEYLSACQSWGAASLSDVAVQPVASEIPTLLISGEYDPATPPEWGEQAAQTLKNGAHFEFPGYGHGVVLAGNSCASDMMLAFLNAPEKKPDGECVKNVGGPDFVTQ